MTLKALKCPVCGAELQVQPDAATCVCSYCDSTITIPKNLERKEALYNRAVFQRQSDEFDKAVATYEELLREDNEDADAHWGLLLSKYGIEYVKDPRSGAQVPTFNRTMAQSILADMDYKAALEYAPMDARAVYEAEGKRLNDIQSHILQISRQEPPYEIFICYKETDNAGARTKDSVIAQDLYGELEKKGYKVFFARKTLEGKLGGEYEPIIYAALSSAPVMVVVGTTPQNFEAPWVHNEWSRFMRMGKAGEKTIIPAYRDMTAYELPAELSNFQAQDMSKLGFMQDLVDGIEKILRRKQNTLHEKITNPVRQSTMTVAGILPLEKLLQNGETYLRLHNYKQAMRTYQDAAKNYPESYLAWWGQIECATNNPTGFFPFAGGIDTFKSLFDYAYQLAPDDKKAELRDRYIESILQAANSLTGEGQFDDAAALYEILNNNKFPQDYRTLWGSIQCATRNFTRNIPYELEEEIKQTVKTIEKIAPADKWVDIQATYMNYLHLLAQKKAATATENDRKRVQAQIKANETKIEELRQPQADMKALKWDIEQKRVPANKKIEEAKKKLEEQKALERHIDFQTYWRPFIKWLGILILPLGIMFLFVALREFNIIDKVPNNIAAYAFLPSWCITAGICLVFRKDESLPSLETSSTKIMREIKKIEQKLANDEKEYAEKCAKLTDIFENQNAPVIARLEDQIESCKRYLSLDDEKIQTIFLAKQLEKINETIVPDEEAVRRRAATLSEADQEVAGTADIQEEQNEETTVTKAEITENLELCPVCHQPKKVLRNHNGQEVCSFCGFIFR